MQADEVLDDVSPQHVLSLEAVRALQDACEAYLTDLFRDAAAVANRRMRGHGRYTHSVMLGAPPIVRDEPSEGLSDYSEDASAESSSSEGEWSDYDSSSSSDEESGSDEQVWTPSDHEESEEDEESASADDDGDPMVLQVVDEQEDVDRATYDAADAPEGTQICELKVNERDMRVAHAIRYSTARRSVPLPGDATALRNHLGPFIAELVNGARRLSEGDMAITRDAVAILEAAAEDYLTELFRDTNRLLTHATPGDRVPIVYPRDVHIVRGIRGPVREALW